MLDVVILVAFKFVNVAFCDNKLELVILVAMIFCDVKFVLFK